MAISDVSLTAGMRSNLLNLQQTSVLLERTQTRLSTGKKVNSALDDPVNFFKAQAYTNRATDLAGLKDGMSDAIQTVKAADAGIKNLTTLIASAKSIAAAARTSSGSADLDALELQFDQVITQIANLAEDSGYGGINLLSSNSLVVTFDPAGSNVLTVTGQASDVAGHIAGITVDPAAFNTNGSPNTGAIATATTQLDSALSALRTQSKNLSSNLGIITSRQDFTASMIAVLQTGADNLTLADMNEEGANMLMLQTRQALGTTALSMASQAAQSVMRLFG